MLFPKGCFPLFMCFSITVQSQGGVLGSRGVGEGAEAEEPAVLKGGKIFVCLIFLQLFVPKLNRFNIQNSV